MASKSRQRPVAEPQKGQRARQEEVENEKLRTARYDSKKVSILDRFNTSQIDPSTFMHTIDNFEAGAISDNLHMWKRLTTDPWILAMVKG